MTNPKLCKYLITNTLKLDIRNDTIPLQNLYKPILYFLGLKITPLLMIVSDLNYTIYQPKNLINRKKLTFYTFNVATFNEGFFTN